MYCRWFVVESPVCTVFTLAHTKKYLNCPVRKLHYFGVIRAANCVSQYAYGIHMYSIRDRYVHTDSNSHLRRANHDTEFSWQHRLFLLHQEHEEWHKSGKTGLTLVTVPTLTTKTQSIIIRTISYSIQGYTDKG